MATAVSILIKILSPKTTTWPLMTKINRIVPAIALPNNVLFGFTQLHDCLALHGLKIHLKVKSLKICESVGLELKPKFYTSER